MENSKHTGGPITPPAGREGYFEITYKVGQAGEGNFELRKICLCAKGYEAAKAAFEQLGLGRYFHQREIDEAAFRAFQEADCCRVAPAEPAATPLARVPAGEQLAPLDLSDPTLGSPEIGGEG